MELQELEKNALQFLSNWNLSFDDIIKYAPDVQKGECLILCSTIPEGLANQSSDIDMIYVGESSLRSAVRMRMNTGIDLDVNFDRAGREYNVNKINPKDLNVLAQSISSSIAVLEKPNLRKLSEAKIEREFSRLMLLHRIADGVPLVNAEVFFEWQRRLSSRKFYLHICFQDLADYLNLQEDVVGELAVGSLESANWIAKQSMARKLVGSLLASVGCTNVNVKWHRKLLDRHRHTIGSQFVDGLVQFIMSPAASTADELKSDIRSACSPVVQDIYRRLPLIQEAAHRFVRAVRYSNLDK